MCQNHSEHSEHSETKRIQRSIDGPTMADGPALGDEMARAELVRLNPDRADDKRCADCGDWFASEDLTAVGSADDSPLYCDDCLQEGFYECDSCGEWTDRDEGISTEDGRVCDGCADGYEFCDGCQEHRARDWWGVWGFSESDCASYCPDCMEGKFVCEDCREVKDNDDVAEFASGAVCRDCYGNSAEVIRGDHGNVGIKTDNGNHVEFPADEWPRVRRIILALAKAAEACASEGRIRNISNRMELGGFEVSRIRADGTVVIGCHDFKLHEVRRFVREEMRGA